MALLTISTLLVTIFFAVSAHAAPRRPVPAIFTFGDSVADVGTNNYLPSSPTKANFPPYGIDYIPASGRFSNGRLVGDYFAKFLHIPSAPAYLNPKGDFTFGVNFASGGATVLLDHVNQTQVLAKSIFFIAAGSNDWVAYLILLQTNPGEAPPALPYFGKVINATVGVVQTLYTLGARKFIIPSLSPLGCDPFLAAYSGAPPGKCSAVVNSGVSDYNAHVKAALEQLGPFLPGSHIMYANTYTRLLRVTNRPAKYGFVGGIDACCGAGKNHAQVQCGKSGPVFAGAKIVVENATLCAKRNRHVYWDAIHPTQGVYHMLAKLFWSGGPAYASPFNLRHLANI